MIPDNQLPLNFAEKPPRGASRRGFPSPEGADTRQGGAAHEDAPPEGAPFSASVAALRADPPAARHIILWLFHNAADHHRRLIAGLALDVRDVAETGAGKFARTRREIGGSTKDGSRGLVDCPQPVLRLCSHMQSDALLGPTHDLAEALAEDMHATLQRAREFWGK